MKALRSLARRHLSRKVRRSAWHALRSNPVTRSLARGRPHEGGRDRGAPRPPAMVGGHQLVTGGSDLPVVVLLALGHDRQQLAAWAEEIACLQALTAGFRPYWLVDSADIALVRRYGWVVDTVVRRTEWDRLRPGADYEDYLRRRVASLARHVGPRVTALVGRPPTVWSDRYQLALSLSVRG